MSTNLKDQLIRLGSERPDLRDHLRPIITAMRGREKELYEQWAQARDDYKDGNRSKSMFQRTMMDLQAQAEEIGADISEWEDKYYRDHRRSSQSMLASLDKQSTDFLMSDSPRDVLHQMEASVLSSVDNYMGLGSLEGMAASFQARNQIRIEDKNSPKSMTVTIVMDRDTSKIKLDPSLGSATVERLDSSKSMDDMVDLIKREVATFFS